MKNQTLTLYWLMLVTLTLLSALFADSLEPNSWITLVVCLTIMVKGQVIVDVFMGLKTAPNKIRYMMLAYFYVLPPMVAIALIFPNAIEQITTL